MHSKEAQNSFKPVLALILSAFAAILSITLATAATCPGATYDTHTCTASYSSSYAYPYEQQTHPLTIYISCDISEQEYAKIGPMPGKQPPVRVYGSDCPQCWYDTHTYNGQTWHCSRVLGGYDYPYFQQTSSVTYYSSCTISAAQKQALINQGYVYDRRERTYDASPGEWTDVHYMVKCPAEQPKKGLGESCGSSNECSSGLKCDYLGQCKNPVGASCTRVSDCEFTSTCDSAVSQCRYITNVECTSDSQCRSDLRCIPGYDGKLRCTAPITTAITSATFADLVGTPITSGDSNDTIMLVAQGTGLNGRNVTFKAYRKQSLLDSKVLEASVFPSSSTTANITFKPTSGGTYYFKASVSGSDTQSADFSVGYTATNTPPVVLLSGPAAGSLYFVGSNITFTHSSYDPDDPITSETWNFGDGSTATGRSTTHAYSTSGQKNIVVEVADGRGAKASGSTSILVANNNGATLFAIIDKPAYGSVLSNASLMVDYSARKSYVVSITTSATSACTTTVTCLQGQCPATTSASPSCASNKNAQIAVTGTPQTHNQISFNWTFKDGMNYLMPESGVGKVNGSKAFADYGQKNITLQLRYTPLGAGSTPLTALTSREFLLLNQRQCSASGTTWYKVSNGFITEARDTLGTVACAGLDLQAGTNDDCCPQGFTCTTGANPGCKLDTNATLACSSYTTQSACTADSADRVRNEVLWQHYNCGNSVGGNNILCACAWNADDSLCEFSRNTRLDNGVSGFLSTCTYTTQTGQCVNGYQTVEITASSNVNGDELCAGSTQILPCSKPVIELPFFSAWQFASGLVAVLLLHLIYSRFVSRK